MVAVASEFEVAPGGVELRPYAPPSFWTTQGAFAKQRQLERKGFPRDLRNWRFVTLTVDPARFPDPFFAWMYGKGKLRKFIFRLRKKYKIRRWCWKLEFHEPDDDGRIYPHWHLLLDYKVKIDVEELQAAWGFGRTNIKRVDDEGFEYLFKYAVKVVDQIPDWILRRTNVRLFQTSKGFFGETKTISANDGAQESENAASPRLSDADQVGETQNNRIDTTRTIGERLQYWSRLVVGRTISDDGRVHHKTYEMRCDSWGLLLVQIANVKLRAGVSDAQLNINEHHIKTSCLYLQKYLSVSM
jgi:hypothetical protein